MQEKPILVQMNNGKWELFAHKVRFADKNGEQEVYTSNIAWYEDFANIHDDFEIIEVTNVEYTLEQLERLEEIKEMDLVDTVVNEYVVDGITGKGLEMLVLEKENKELKQLLADLAELVLFGGV
jgi:thiamine pyrophosphate-dependent acetolactate synthase large subunit-like protein